MQNLALADNHMLAIENGGKTIAVRVGYCKIEPGPLEIKSASGFWPKASVTVLSVERKPISALTSDELRQSGYSTPDAMVDILKVAHPCVSTDTEATVIRWETAR